MSEIAHDIPEISHESLDHFSSTRQKITLIYLLLDAVVRNWGITVIMTGGQIKFILKMSANKSVYIKEKFVITTIHCNW